jgi:predicted amidohydrolase YtcJ
VRYGVELSRTADLTGSRSLDELLHRLKAHAETHAGEWVIGRGFDQELLREGRFPTRDDLDGAFPNRPALIQRICCHALVANGAALSRAGLASPDGLFTEDAMAPVLRTVPEPTLEETVQGARQAIRSYHLNGFTSAHVIIGHPLEVRALQVLRQRGGLTMTLRLILPYGWIDALETAGITAGFGDERLSIDGLKSFADGSLGARTAALRQPYHDDPGNYGLPLLSGEEIETRIRSAHRAGLKSIIHAIGDAAVDAVVAAAERAAPDGPPPRMEHASVVDPGQAERMGRLGMCAAVQPQFIASDFWTPDRLGPERASWAYAFRTLMNAGVTLAASTDCPVEKPVAGEVYTGFVRRADKRDGERLTPMEALQAFTLDADRSLGLAPVEPWKPGSPADFLLLREGTEWPPDAKDGLPVEETVVRGEIVTSASRGDDVRKDST